MTTRRNFIKNTALGMAGISLLSSTKAYANIIGSNETVNAAILGTGGRSYALAQSIGLASNIKLVYACDVDSNRLNDFKNYCNKTLGYEPSLEKDFRKVLEKKDVDAILIATPEHWHAPMAIMALQAGKHVYVEKPCSHNPYETELLIAAQAKYQKVVQMGNQQRSSESSSIAIKDIRDGLIGDVYNAKAFYSNTRGPIGTGKVVSVPNHLDWDLWQGPAPRENYRDNVHPYNWHWFKTWGTGEIHNNGTHEIDICRWALGVDYPIRVVSTGGRLHYKGDDWEWFDTQLASYEFEGGKMLSWEGNSCNGFNKGGGRGVYIYGTKGSMHLNREKYTLYDLGGREIKTVNEQHKGTSNNTADLSGFDGLTVKHIQNFANAIRTNEQLKSPIASAGISTQLCHLGNIAQEVGESLKIDPATGKVVGNKAAAKLWKREYEKGWEPKI
ncbi:Gfo/Idh/MocA family protein [Carboxylicivirga caseinilyticus]|uniref:Gfo/Idh/MocA family protein n=1 Tax=Carboxylicivirga caseinilyticus TaxID=3417572 RepID=UPI003D329075|nr:Gfo/Idh/MocA family oxidoreductase [Marinilabiliaceae bacterium A049]